MARRALKLHSFKVRFPRLLFAELKTEAKKSGRSLNYEILQRLYGSVGAIKIENDHKAILQAIREVALAPREVIAADDLSILHICPTPSACAPQCKNIAPLAYRSPAAYSANDADAWLVN